MRCLNNLEVSKIHGGMSETALVCIEGGGIGVVAGGLIGATLASPVYYTLINREGISSSHHLMGMFVIGVGIIAGAFFGSVIGTGSGFIAACQLEDAEE